MSIKNFFIGVLIGGIAGVVSSASAFLSGDLFFLFFFLGPGMIFGLVTIFYFAFFAKPNGGLMQPLAWIFMSAVSYFIAVIVVMTGPKNTLCGGMGCQSSPIAFLLGGGVGAAVLSLSFTLIINTLSARYIAAVIIAGGLIAFLYHLSIPQEIQSYADSLFYVIWQGVVCGLLAASQPEIHLKRKSS